ncbi:ATP-binding protein [Alkalicoccus daliensis]|uniref:histidine kinase n=1 Tax=Alkalicoccus daliensis TaxID=745820 RepID=A0A1H0KQ85_9BACI|nr:ATP-binding protein [Alkalicoccus daliensis]SDO57933.1 Signal transduction histidine kinase [Alkalicoccus daliensis]
MKKMVVMLILLLFFVPSVHAEILHELDEEEGIANIHMHMEVLEDETGELQLEEVQELEFEEVTGAAPSYGYTESVYWAKFMVDASTAEDMWYLKLDNPTMDNVVIYEVGPDNDVETREAGDLFPYNQRELNNRVFVFRYDFSEREGIYTYYMRHETEGAMQLPITFSNQTVYSENTQSDYLILGLLAGLAGVMAVYNFFIYLSLKNSSYLYYVMFIVVNLFTFLSFTGLAYQFIWPEAVWWNNRAIIFFLTLSNIMALLFARNFLELRKLIPKALRYFQIAIAANIIILLIWIFSYSIALEISIVASILTVFVVLTTAVIRFRQGYHPAIYFIFAWQFFVVGVIISISTDLGVVPYSFFTKYAWQIFTSVELILFSFALTNKINIIRQEKDRARQEMLETLQRTDELKNEFLAMTSHELRTPLNGMIGIAESLKEGAAGKQTKLTRYNLDLIVKSGERLALLIGDITDFSRLENKDFHLRISKVDIVETLNVVVQMIRVMNNKPTLEIINKVKKLPLIYADEHRIQQILYNLLINAVRYTKEGSIIIEGKADAEKVTLFMKDTGIGISENELQLIFDPFQRGTNADHSYKEGMGIGLHLSKRLIELQGGEITLQSQLGEGSTFSFSFPVAEEAHQKNMQLEKEHMNAAPVPEAPVSREMLQGRILIADDEEVNVRVLTNYLRLAGYEVTAVSNGSEVLEKVSSGNYDLIIMDVMMPKISGYNACRELRKTYSYTELPILMLTARGLIEDRLAAYETGANDYLVKPVDRRELLIRVETHIKLSRAVFELEERRIELEGLNEILERKVEIRTSELETKNSELEYKNEQLTEMEASRIEMLSNISHELGTPVTFLQNYIQTVKEGFIDANDEKYLKIVQQKIHLLDRLIFDLFDLVKLESGSMNMMLQEIEIHAFLEEMYHYFSWELKEAGIHFPPPVLKGITNEDDYFVCIDKERLLQVFSNLIGNARKFVKEDPFIQIEAALLPADAEGDTKLRISIYDNGEGIKAEELQSIFKRFYKVTDYKQKKAIQGTGLGLAITKEIVEHHQGTIWAESIPGNGTVLSFTLPAVKKSEEKGMEYYG